ncbi:MAG: hypothetical protein CMI54_02010 [Parcubacteria group bacterium]|jgi:hypothetical protein|nr:hypothetical protein [Parcubacteria group bacterium]|tara:strand:- start:653 stop:1195 length:543 start_codon:yes stop_codon:yes gene_type:complete
MAEPNDRRIIWGTHVIPQDEYTNPGNEETLENGMTVGVASYTDYRIDPTVGKTFGGKGIVTIDTDQPTDHWTSMMHERHYWEAHGETFWEDFTETWDGDLHILATTTLMASLSGKRKFVYIKNTGDTNDVSMTIDGTNLSILIPPGAAFAARLNTDVVDQGEIKVASGGSGTTIEFILAS